MTVPSDEAAAALTCMAVHRRGTPVQPDQHTVDRLLATLRRLLR